MREYQGKQLYSATDLVNFLGCAHATALDIRQLSAPVELETDDAQTELLRKKGIEHERSYLAKLHGEGRSIAGFRVIGPT
jgi:uncharacterized protein